MPIIRTVGGIVEIYPSLPVSHRPPATQADADHRRDRAKDQERQDADPCPGPHDLTRHLVAL